MKSQIKLTLRGDVVNPHLHLPEHVERFREGQLEKIQSLISNFAQPGHTTQQFQAVQDQVGSGKTVTYTAAAAATGLRTCIVTGSKALQDQIEAEFGGEDGIVADIRGVANYHCSHKGAANCEEGRRGNCANAKSARCPAELAYRTACDSQIVCTNYALWMLDVRVEPRDGRRKCLGKFDLVVFDEAHSAMDQICGGVGGELGPGDFEIIKGLNVLESPKDEARQRPKSWAKWSGGAIGRVSQEVLDLQRSQGTAANVRRLLRCDRIKHTLKRMKRGKNRDWVVDLPVSNHVVSQPVWPRGFLSEFAGSTLNVLLTSATIPPKVLELLGIPSSVIYHDYPSIFDPARSPNLILPCGSMKFQSEQSTFPALVRRLRNVLAMADEGNYLYRTIIHTVSYSRALRLYAALKDYQHRIILNSRGRFEWAMSRYLQRSNAIFISPSLTTGVDLKQDLCRLNIMIKAPFANTTSNIERLRYKIDPDYYYFKAVLTVRQALGRGMREWNDWCRNLMMDSDIGWLINANRRHLNRDFRTTYVNTVPGVFQQIKGER